MSERFDVIIIGGGLGGLVCGAKLAHEGKRILLLEQHNVTGGCATTFRHKEFNLEVGLHEMDGFAAGNLKNKIFRELGVFNHIDFAEPEFFYRFVHEDDKIEHKTYHFIDVPHQAKEAQANFTDRFPDQAEGISIYFERLTNFRKYRSAENSGQQTLGEYLDSIISSDELKLALCGNLMAFSDDPYKITLDYFAQAQGTFHLSGGVFVKKGSQQLSDYFTNYILSHHGCVKLHCRAEKIITENNRATGVQYHHLSDPATSFQATAGHIVANTSALNVARDLLSHSGMKERFEQNKIGPSLYTLYLCFDKPLKEIGNSAYCTCIFPEQIKKLSDIGKTNQEDFDNKYFVLTDYSQIESGLAPEGKSVAVIVCIDYAEHWRNFSRDEYKAEKERVAKGFIQRLEKYLPGASRHLVYYDSATPLTIERYTLNPEGAIYGYAQSPGKIALQTHEYFPNLFLASAWDKFGGGFSGAIYSGYFAGIEIMRQQRMMING